MKRSTITVLLAAGLLGSLGVNLFFFGAIKERYTKENAVRLDPIGLDVFASERAKPLEGSAALRVVFFGDSRSMMWAAPAATEGVRFDNRGISHQTTAQALLRAERELPPLRPDVVVLQLGVNDLKAIPLFPGREQEIIDGVSANIAALIDLCRRLHARVVLVTVFPTADIEVWRVPFWTDRVPRAVGLVNDELRKLVAPDVLLLEANETLLDVRGEMHPGFAMDALHLNEPAYRALNEQQLMPAIRALRDQKKSGAGVLPDGAP